MSPDYTPTVESIDAIANGRHSDPFTVLGPHAGRDGVTIRAFLPEVQSAEVITSADETLAMTRVHDGGVFEAVVRGARPPLSYRLRLTFPGGETSLVDDPYAFTATLTDYDEYLLAEGTHFRMYDRLGAHLAVVDGVAGVQFAVWAPNAWLVSVIGDFNRWDGRRHPMRFHANSGIWDIFIPGLGEGALYKYEVRTRYPDYRFAKSDPVGFYSEIRPQTASIVWDLDKHAWRDQHWMEKRAVEPHLRRPLNVYEVHLGSWRRDENGAWLSYRDLAQQLIPYVKEMGYTHLELLPVAEHPYDASWGYQVTGYYAATSRYGNPDDLMAFIDACHQAEVGVILDWVPAHFPRDAHGLALFDGTHLYEHEDPRQGAHPDWGTLIFNYGRLEVRQFLVSNALFWLDKYHVDGLRVDAVASMLYRDFSRQPGQWIPNRFGGRENLEAIDFLRLFNRQVHTQFPGVMTLAEESTAWPGVTRSINEGGLGFDLKWNMGWMHDTLRYFQNDPIYRAFHHGTLTFSLLYAFSEQFLLPLSHDEVVHLKRSMLDKMPGDLWQKFANLRLLYGYQIAHPGKKMLFMGGEFGQWQEWSEARSLDWHLLENGDLHAGLRAFVRRLNNLYAAEASLFESDDSWSGFEWLDLHDAQRSILAFARHAAITGESVYVVCNFTPVVRENYTLSVRSAGRYVEILNSDADEFGGSGLIHDRPLEAEERPGQDRPFVIELTLPPLGVTMWKLLVGEP